MTEGTGPSRAERPASGLLARSLSALALAPPVLAMVFMGGPFFVVLVGVGAGILAWEWRRLCGAAVLAGGAVGAALLLALLALAQGAPEMAVAGLAVGAAVAAAIGTPERRWWLAFGVGYLGLPCLALTWLRGDPEFGMATVFWMLAVVWASDIGGYVFGRTLGGPKLAPAISPGKTWSGLAGAMIWAGAAGAVAALVLDKGVTALVVISGLLGLVGQGGDLAESWIKRRFGVKDSGSLIPGHGGLLDRVDALLAVAVTLALVRMITGSGVLSWL